MSCLFISLAPSVNLDHIVLRKNIVDFLETNPVLLDNVKASDIIFWTEKQEFKGYLNNMNKSSTWGGAIEIRAFCELYTLNVCVHVQYTGKFFMVYSSKSSNKTVHINYTGSHYTPMYTVII